MGINSNKVFLFDNKILNDQLLKTYIECSVKYNTLSWYLYYEDFFIEHTHTCLLDMNTPMKSISINEDSSQEELAYYFRYLKACHLGVEYIEHGLKLLLMLEGHDIKEITKECSDHNLEKLFDMLSDEKTKTLIMGAVGWPGEEYIKNVLDGKPANIIYPPVDEEVVEVKWTDEEVLLNGEDGLYAKVARGEELTAAEAACYIEFDEEELEHYREHKYDESNYVSKKYFSAIMKILSNSFVDLRYPEVGKLNNKYNLEVILSLAHRIDTALTMNIETSRLDEFDRDNLDEYIGKLLDCDEDATDYNVDNSLNILNRPLTSFERKKMHVANNAKYEALKWYMYGMEEFYLTGRNEYGTSLMDILYTTSITREQVCKKSDDQKIYENYLYYQACHMASDYIEHSLKLLLLDNGYTYDELMQQFVHDFKKMYSALREEDQENIKLVVSTLGERYLQKVANPNLKFRDVIKQTSEEQAESNEMRKYFELCKKRDVDGQITLEELEYIKKYEEEHFAWKKTGNTISKDKLEEQNDGEKYFDDILTQSAKAFKFTRYPDFYNYNMNYKYCMKFLLAFAQGLQTDIAFNMKESQFSSSSSDTTGQMQGGKK